MLTNLVKFVYIIVITRVMFYVSYHKFYTIILQNNNNTLYNFYSYKIILIVLNLNIVISTIRKIVDYNIDYMI